MREIDHKGRGREITEEGKDHRGREREVTEKSQRWIFAEKQHEHLKKGQEYGKLQEMGETLHSQEHFEQICRMEGGDDFQELGSLKDELEAR